MVTKVLHRQQKSSYQIKFSENFNNFIRRNKKKYEKIAILTDTNIYRLYNNIFKDNNILIIKIKPGEKSKSRETKTNIEKFLFKFQNLESKFKKHEFNYFLLYRFIGGIPFVIANLIPVLFNISIKNYFVGTFFGIIPQLFLIVSLGSGLDKIFQLNETVPSITDLIFSPEIYIPILGFIFIVLITIIIRKFFYKKK